MQTPVIETDRLILRVPCAADASAVLGFLGSEHGQYYGGPLKPQQAWTKLSAYIGQWVLLGYGMFAITLKDGGDTIGMSGPVQPALQPEPEMSWLLTAPAHEGKGYAFEASQAVIAHLFRAHSWDSMVSFIHPGNAASVRLAQRLGAVRDPATPSEIKGCDTWRHHRGAA